MDNRCLGDVCKSLETQSPEKAAACVKPRTVVEDIDSCAFLLTFHSIPFLTIPYLTFHEPTPFPFFYLILDALLLHCKSGLS